MIPTMLRSDPCIAPTPRPSVYLELCRMRELERQLLRTDAALSDLDTINLSDLGAEVIPFRRKS